MLIDETKKYNLVWDRVYKELGFFPDSSYEGHSFEVKLPFQINKEYEVFDIDCDWADEADDLIREAFINCTKPGEKMYALDWQHSAFLYDPRNISEQQSIWVDDDSCFDGGYYGYFPDFYPDGDYYFFIDEEFRFGYLSHPWRREVWIFGEMLIKEFEKIYFNIGWRKII